jgi:hypothetical protein
MLINPENAGRIETYARRSGKPASTVLNEALDYWYEMYGEIILEEMVKRDRSGKLVVFPSVS